MLTTANLTTTTSLTEPRTQKIKEAADQLEATFLAEMLKSAGYGASRDAFGGGIGEEQFSSFLRNQHAELLVKAGGIGLSEQLFNSMMENYKNA